MDQKFIMRQSNLTFYNEAVKFNLDNKIDALQRFIKTLIQNGAKEIIQQ